MPRTDLDYDQPAALGALLRLDAGLGTAYADRFTGPDGPWDGWVRARKPSDESSYTPERLRRPADLRGDFADGWTLP
ncbi:DUF6000 family protein [Streptomyces sp. NPDC059534]|uniref:DUF6000 family protein n=1 Tax=Streptomyces sp. NPDC059534 TaxID=3346859 RepID=UPI0036CD05DC